MLQFANNKTNKKNLTVQKGSFLMRFAFLQLVTVTLVTLVLQLLQLVSRRGLTKGFRAWV